MFSIGLYSQPWLKNLPRTKTAGKLTFADYQKAFYDYWKPFKVDNKGYYLKDGKKVKAEVTIPIKFKLDDNKKKDKKR